MLVVRLVPVFALLLVMGMVQPAVAMLQFYKVYKAEYLDNHSNQEFAAEAMKPANRCFACHQGKKRKNHNPFGEKLTVLLDRKKDLKNVEKISASIKQVLAEHVDPNDPNSETYGERLAAGKWPGGELEDLKKEPEDESGDADQGP